MRLSDDVLGVLSTLEFPTLTTAKIVDRLDRKAYAKVNEALEAIGGKWSKREQSHVSGEDARALIDRVIDTGQVTTMAELGFFPTPGPLARQLVEEAEIGPSHSVLEPSAGTGRIVDAILERKPERLTAVERDPKMRAALIERTRLRGLPFWVADVDDFMNYQPMYGGDGGVKRVDRVVMNVMNPPFGRFGIGDHLDHVRHAHWLLSRGGGILLSVLPAGVTFRRDRRHREFREWVTKLGGEITALPDGSFKESGTDVRSVKLRIRA